MKRREGEKGRVEYGRGEVKGRGVRRVGESRVGE